MLPWGLQGASPAPGRGDRGRAAPKNQVGPADCPLQRRPLCAVEALPPRPFPPDAPRCPPQGWHLAGPLVAASSSDQAFPLPRGGSETQGCSTPLERELSCIVTAPRCPDTLQDVAEALKSHIACKCTFTGASSGRRVQSFSRIMRRSSRAASQSLAVTDLFLPRRP